MKHSGSMHAIMKEREKGTSWIRLSKTYATELSHEQGFHMKQPRARGAQATICQPE